MKKITENALLYRVNQLREKMAVIEAAGDGSMTPNPRALFPDQSPTATQRHADPNNAQGYNVKPYQQPTTPPAGNTTTPPAGNTTTPPAGNTTTPPATQTQTQTTTPAAPEGHWYDPAVNLAHRVGDDLSYAADHAAEIGQGVGKTAAGMASSVGNAVDAAGNFISGAVKGATGGTQGQQKVGANQGAGKWPATPAEIQAFQKANGLKVDGLIGANTMAALQKQGVQPPAGFKPVASKQPTAQQGTAAKPAAGAAPVAGQVMPNGSVSSGDADRDERLAQANQVMNMTPDQRHAFDMAAGQKDYAATHPAASATNKAPVGGQMQSTGDPVKDSELSKQGNTIVYKEDQDLARIVQLVNW
jgi:Putative peptidoglycan binding domain